MGSRGARAVAVGLAACVAVGGGLGGCARRGAGGRAGPPRPGADEAALAVARADAARRAGEPERAATLYEEAVRRHPGSALAHLRWASSLQALGRRSLARDHYAARARGPGAGPAEHALAARLSGDGSLDSLRRAYAAAAAAQPAEPWWRLASAEVELAAAQAALAEAQDLAAAGESDRADEARARSRAATAAAAAHAAAAEAARPGLAEAALVRGLARAAQADLARSADERRRGHEAAVSEFGRALVRDPSLVEAWAALAESRVRVGEDGEALLAYVQALRLAPADASLREGAAHVLRTLDRPLDAAQQYRVVASLRPRAARPALDLGDALAEGGKFDDALLAYAEALRRDPREVEAHRRIGAVQEHLCRVPQARAAYDAYVAAGGEDADAVRRRARRLLGAPAAAPSAASGAAGPRGGGSRGARP